MRSFLAVYPDESARRALADVALEDAIDVRVTDMAEWHVTIRFLGELDDEDVAAVAKAAATSLLDVAPFTVHLGPATALGTGARVLFAPARGAEHVAQVLDEALFGMVAPRAGPYRGHLTLARARGRGRLPGTLSGVPLRVSFEATEVALVGSRLEPHRAVHHVERRFGLGGGGST